MLRLTDLREILRYVPHFRDRLFVIAIDGALVEDDNFGNLLLDIALLRSLRIGVALVHGASHQVRQLAERVGQELSNADGTGVTDPATLQVSLTAANRVSHEILEGLSANDLRGAIGNAVVAHPAGILMGVDHQFTGKVERVDVAFLNALLEHDVIPVIPPVGCDGEGRTYRLNSDSVAYEVARALRAVKLVYLTGGPGVVRGGELLRQMTVEEADQILKRHRSEMSHESATKLEFAIKAARDGVPRVHVIDGRLREGLLAEAFSNEGIGTLIHANEYQSIRRAHKKDARAIQALIQTGVANDELLPRSREIAAKIEDYFVFEVDRNPVACAAVHPYPDEGKGELACVFVDPRYENRGIGAKLIRYAEDYARLRGLRQLFLLSTQTFNYFQAKGGFEQGTPEDLPRGRRERYDASGRKSLVLVKGL